MTPSKEPDQSLSRAYAVAAEHVRELDIDRYLSCLFAPTERQPHLFAIYAFNAEISRVRSIVSNALPGEMRYQWWRDFLAGSEAEGSTSNPLATALMATIKGNSLPIKPFIDLLEARTFDLYDDPMPTWGDCEGYCGETSSALIRLASLILAKGEDDGGAEAAGHAGVALALTGLLRAFPWTCQRGQLFLPKEAFEHRDVAINDVHSGKDSPALRDALADIRLRSRSHLQKTRELITNVPPRIAPAFYPVCFVEPYLKVMEARNYNPFQTRVDTSRLSKLFTLWRQSRRACR